MFRMVRIGAYHVWSYRHFCGCVSLHDGRRVHGESHFALDRLGIVPVPCDVPTKALVLGHDLQCLCPCKSPPSRGDAPLQQEKKKKKGKKRRSSCLGYGMAQTHRDTQRPHRHRHRHRHRSTTHHNSSLVQHCPVSRLIAKLSPIFPTWHLQPPTVDKSARMNGDGDGEEVQGSDSLSPTAHVELAAASQDLNASNSSQEAEGVHDEDTQHNTGSEEDELESGDDNGDVDDGEGSSGSSSDESGDSSGSSDSSDESDESDESEMGQSLRQRLATRRPSLLRGGALGREPLLRLDLDGSPPPRSKPQSKRAAHTSSRTVSPFEFGGDTDPEHSSSSSNDDDDDDDDDDDADTNRNIEAAGSATHHSQSKKAPTPLLLPTPLSTSSSASSSAPASTGPPTLPPTFPSTVRTSSKAGKPASPARPASRRRSKSTAATPARVPGTDILLPRGLTRKIAEFSKTFDASSYRK